MKRVLWRAAMIIAVLTLGIGAIAASEVTEAWVNDVTSPQYFALYVEDVDQSVEWYCAAFGLRLLGGSAAEDGSWRIENLVNDALWIEIIRDDRAQVVDRALGFRKVGFYVVDIDKVADRAEDATGVRPRVVEFEELGQRILQLKDPDGNTIQLMSPLAGPE